MLAATPSPPPGPRGAQVPGEFEEDPAAHAVRGDRQPLGLHRVERVGRASPRRGRPPGAAPGRPSRGGAHWPEVHRPRWATLLRGCDARPGPGGTGCRRRVGGSHPGRLQVQRWGRRPDGGTITARGFSCTFMTAAIVGRRRDLHPRGAPLLRRCSPCPVWGTYQKASPQGDPAWAAFVPDLQLHRPAAGGRAPEVVGLVPPAAPGPLPREPRAAGDLDLRPQRRVQELRPRRRLHRRSGPAAGDLLVHPLAGQEPVPRPEGPARPCRPAATVPAACRNPGTPARVAIRPRRRRLSPAGRLPSAASPGAGYPPPPQPGTAYPPPPPPARVESRRPRRRPRHPRHRRLRPRDPPEGTGQ